MLGHRVVHSEMRTRAKKFDRNTFLAPVTGQKLTLISSSGEDSNMNNENGSTSTLRILDGRPIGLDFSQVFDADDNGVSIQPWAQFVGDVKPPSRSALASRQRERLHLQLDALVASATRESDSNLVVSDLRHVHSSRPPAALSPISLRPQQAPSVQTSRMSPHRARTAQVAQVYYTMYYVII
jgi:hypothetical protein